QGNHLQVIEDMLAIRAGKKANVTKGPLAASLKNVPAGAFGVFTMELPDDLRAQMAGPFSPFKVAPRTMHAESVRLEKGIGVHTKFTLPSPEDAKTFLTNIDDLKEQAIAAIKSGTPGVKVSPKSQKALTEMFQNFKLKAAGKNVTGGVTASHAVVPAL